MSVTLQHKAQLYGQLYHGLKAGVPLERLLSAEALPPPFAAQSRRLVRNVQEGRSLHATLRTAGITQSWEEQLLAIGEDSGRVPHVLRDLSDFFEVRRRQLQALKAKLVYPLLVVIAAILIQPIPALANGSLSPAAYAAGAAVKLLILYAAFRLLVARPFERAVGAAFNPLLLRVLRHVGDEHWLRLHYEVAYLDLVTLCLDCGLNAAEALRLLGDAAPDADYRQTHALALQRIEIAGLSLAQVLIGMGLVRSSALQNFLVTSENSGTLHSDLRTILIRKRAENAAAFEGFVTKVALWLYAGAMLLLLGSYL